MKMICFFTFFILLSSFSIALAGLDFEQKVLHIPETHESKKYLWDVRNNPEDFKLTLTRTQKGETGTISFIAKISLPQDESIEKVHVFVVDKKLQVFEHIFPDRQDENSYSFDFTPSKKGNYRVETVLQTNKGWVKLSRNLQLTSGHARALKPESRISKERDYQIHFTIIPKKIYADHVATLVFEIYLDGKPVTDLELINGSEMHLAAWGTSLFKRFGEFTYATSTQNLGGPEAAVSLVFRDNGVHKVFVEFMHRGKIQGIETEFSVFFEPK